MKNNTVNSSLKLNILLQDKSFSHYGKLIQTYLHLIITSLWLLSSSVVAKDDTANMNDAISAMSEHLNQASLTRLKVDVSFLANDLLEGREAGTVGYGLAAGYVGGQFSAIGLAPAGNDNTYFQPVQMVTSDLILDKSAGISISDQAGNAIQANAKIAVDYITRPKVGQTLSKAQGELVFVGYGFSSPNYEQDDFVDIDLTDKIAVVLRGGPHNLNSEERAHFGATQNERLSERGAIGTIMLFTPTEAAEIPFERLMKYFSSFSSMSWINDKGESYSSAPNIAASAILGSEYAKALFAGQPISWSDVVAYKAEERSSLPSFDMGLSANIIAEAQVGSISSPNVLGYLPGTDPALAKEYIVVTAHLDHLGKTPTPESGDDEINNGAMDNAVGIAAMLEAARLLKANPSKRPVVFLALTGEEKGLVGSDYFIRNPTLNNGKVVANINLDMPILTYEFTDFVAFGAERSTLYPEVKAAVESLDVTLSPDPVPEKGLFTRSDQYSFVEQGVPAVFLSTGWENGGKEAQADFIKNHYHSVTDEASLVNFEQLKRFTDINFTIIRNVGNMKARPKWVKDDFFGKIFNGEMEK